MFRFFHVRVITDEIDKKQDVNTTVKRPCTLYYVAHSGRFEMEPNLDCGLEIVFRVIDSRSRSEKPLIITANLSMGILMHAEELPHRRTYDGIFEKCVELQFKDVDYREKIHK